MKWFNIVVSNREAYAARKSLFFLFSSPVPLVPPFLIANEPWLSGFEVGHAHPSKVVHNGLRHPNGRKEVQITNPHLDWTGSSSLLRFILANTTH